MRVTVPPDEQLSERLGMVLGERYEILELLGAGAQGAVYKALDKRDREHVAVKILHRQVMTDADARMRMFREAQALVALQGTGALAILDQMFTRQGALCLVTELLNGEDLDDYMTRLKEQAQYISVDEAHTIFSSVAATLDAAHQRDIVHRDLKPGNIFLHREADGRLAPRVVDFGFAKLLRQTSMTAAGFIAGSPSYIAPESWKGMKVDYRVDLYSFAACIFRAFGGRAPFTGPNPIDFLRQHTQAERPSLHALRPDLSPRVDDWVQQALAIDPAHRFNTARAVWGALASTLS